MSRSGVESGARSRILMAAEVGIVDEGSGDAGFAFGGETYQSGATPDDKVAAADGQWLISFQSLS